MGIAAVKEAVVGARGGGGRTRRWVVHEAVAGARGGGWCTRRRVAVETAEVAAVVEAMLPNLPTTHHVLWPLLCTMAATKAATRYYGRTAPGFASSRAPSTFGAP